MSNPDLTQKIQHAQSAIKDGLLVYRQKSESEEPIDEITDALFTQLAAKILALKVLLGGNELMETIEKLIEFNQ